MAIVLQPSGLTKAYTEAAQAAGQAAAVRTEKQRGFEKEQQQASQMFQEKMFGLQQQANLEAEARAKSWEMEKMEIVSRKEFAKEQFATDLELKRMQLNSELLMQREVQKRAQALDDLDTSNKAIKDWAKKEGLEGDPDIDKMILVNTVRALTDNPDLQDVLFPEDKVQTRKAAEEQAKAAAILADTNLTPEEKRDAITQLKTGVRPTTEKQIFTPAKVQEFLGNLMTGYAASPTLPTMRVKLKDNKQAYETAVLQEFGPQWRMLVPEAANFIDQKFGGPVATATEDAFSQAPKSRAELEAVTSQLINIDRDKAREYWNTWEPYTR